MFTRVTFVRHSTGENCETIKRIVKESIFPAAQIQKGYGGFLFLSNRDDGEDIIIAFWDTEADIQESEDSGFYEQQIGKIRPFLSAPTTMKHYKVVLRSEASVKTTSFARVSFGNFEPDDSDVIDKILEKSIAPACRGQKGYDGYLELSSTETGEDITISFWDSEANMHGCEDTGYYNQQVDKLMPFLLARPSRQYFDVIVRDEIGVTTAP